MSLNLKTALYYKKQNKKKKHLFVNLAFFLELIHRNGIFSVYCALVVHLIQPKSSEVHLLCNKAATFGPFATHREEKSQKKRTSVSAMKRTHLLVFSILCKDAACWIMNSFYIFIGDFLHVKTWSETPTAPVVDLMNETWMLPFCCAGNKKQRERVADQPH